MTELPNNFSHAVMFHHFYDEKHLKGQGAISGEGIRTNSRLVK